MRLPFVVAAASLVASTAGALEYSVDIGEISVGASLGVEDLRFAIDLRDGRLRLRSGPIHSGRTTVLTSSELTCADTVLTSHDLKCPGGRLRLEMANGVVTEFPVDLEMTRPLAGGAWAGRLAIAGGGIEFSADADTRVRFQSLALEELKPLLTPLLELPADLIGNLSGVATLATQASMRTIRGELQFNGLGFNSDSSAEGLSGALSVSAQISDQQTTADVTFSLDAGIAYLVPGLTLAGVEPGFLVDMAVGPATAEASLTWSGSAPLAIDAVRITHPSGASLAGRARLDQERLEPLEIDVRLDAPDLGPVYTDLVQPVLLGTPLSELEIIGAMGIEVRYAEAAVQRLALEFSEVFFEDLQSGRFRLDNLDGSFNYTRGQAMQASSLSWSGMRLYRFELGGADLALASQNAALGLTGPLSIEFYDGAIEVSSLYVDVKDSSDIEAHAAARLVPVDLEPLTTALGWPVFRGTLGGEISDVAYRDRRLTLNEPLRVDVFNGAVSIDHLELIEPFGNLPRLLADIELRDLDLEALSSAFSFGRIAGLLGGYVRGLQLEDWQPVAFDLDLKTPPGDRSRHRISQQAVDNLGVLGGGSGNALSGGMLRFFSEYSYGEIGISCRLVNGYCEMGGVQDTEDGFYILTPGGLLPPWVAVTGTGRSIKWDTLVEGLQRIAQGEFDIR